MKACIYMMEVEFNCPYCKREHSDIDDKYLTRLNKNKLPYTKVKCECGEKFGMTYNMMGNAISFEL